MRGIEEYGLIRPDGLYVQSIAESLEVAIAAQPEGTVAVPLRPGGDYDWNGSEWAYAPRAAEVPTSVTRAQARIILYEDGLLPQVEALVETHPYFQLRIWWQDALTFERDNAYLSALASELGLSEEQVDDLFIRASTRI